MRLRHRLEPAILDDVLIGSNQRETVLLLGKLAEAGAQRKIHFDASENFVVLEVGKRGSGKSFGMGALLEAFATREANCSIAHHGERRAVVLLDPLDVHWPAIYALSDAGGKQMQRQLANLKSWADMKAEDLNVEVWMPAGYGRPNDPPEFREYHVAVQDLSSEDWALLLEIDLATEARGQLLDEAYAKVTRLGWVRNSQQVAPNPQYGIGDLLDCINNDGDIQNFYQAITIRALVRALRAFAAKPLFSQAAGTPITQILQPGRLSIVCLGRLDQSMRSVLTSVLAQSLLADRKIASDIRRRLDLGRASLTPEQVRTLETDLERHVPRTVMAIDEAQMLLPTSGSSRASRIVEELILTGRNYGIAMWLATQVPKGAISERARRQIDTFIVHRLSIKEDIDSVCGMLQSNIPSKILQNEVEIGVDSLIRSLRVGQAVVSSAESNANRLFIADVRPRVVAHGGEAF